MKKSERNLANISPPKCGRSAIFGAAPLINGEDPAAYDELLERISGAVIPSGIIEEIWVQDVVNLVWETLRLRRLQTSLLQSEAHNGLQKILQDLLEYSEARNLASQWVARDRDAIKEVKSVLKSADLTFDAVMAKTLVLNIDNFERLDRMIMTLESRRDVILKEIDRHRATLGEKLRRVTENIEDAEFEDVETKEVRARHVA